MGVVLCGSLCGIISQGEIGGVSRKPLSWGAPERQQVKLLWGEGTRGEGCSGHNVSS